MQQPSMMSALGGVLSLYLGISFATLFEIVEIFIDLIQNMINYIAGRPVGRKYHVMWTQSTFIINCRGWIMLFYHCIPFTLFRQLCDHISLLNWIHFTLDYAIISLHTLFISLAELSNSIFVYTPKRLNYWTLSLQRPCG